MERELDGVEFKRVDGRSTPPVFPAVDLTSGKGLADFPRLKVLAELLVEPLDWLESAAVAAEVVMAVEDKTGEEFCGRMCCC